MFPHFEKFILMKQNETTTSDSTGNNTLLAVSGQTKFIKTLWIKEYGNLNGDENERDGYFVCGFVHEALKAACASGAVDTVAARGLSEHVCGAQGFNPMLCDTCEGCENERKSYDGQP